MGTHRLRTSLDTLNSCHRRSRCVISTVLGRRRCVTDPGDGEPIELDDASVRRAVVRIDALLEGDGVVFVLVASRTDQFRVTGVLPSCAGAAMKGSVAYFVKVRY
jgi:hypothetical protein